MGKRLENNKLADRFVRMLLVVTLLAAMAPAFGSTLAAKPESALSAMAAGHGDESGCICCFFDDEVHEAHEHGESCPLYEPEECVCDPEEKEDDLCVDNECPQYEIICNCDAEAESGTGDHEESCPAYIEPIYANKTRLIDALPSLEEVKTRDLAGVLRVQTKLTVIRDLAAESLDGLTEAEDTTRFNAELGSERIEKYNNLFLYVDEYIRNNSETPGLSGIAIDPESVLTFIEEEKIPAGAANGEPEKTAAEDPEQFEEKKRTVSEGPEDILDDTASGFGEEPVCACGFSDGENNAGFDDEYEHSEECPLYRTPESAGDPEPETEEDAPQYEEQIDLGPRSLSPAAATPINLATGRVVVDAGGVTLYNGVAPTATINTFYPYNPEGYRLYGSSTTHAAISRVLVTPGVEVTLYFDGLTITNNNWDCVTVTGADVTIVLLDGKTNNINCGYGSATTGGAAIAKNDATDGRSLTIRCEHSDELGHICVENTSAGSCGKLNAVGTATVTHAGAIGSTLSTGGVYSGKGGFANLYIEGGIITAKAGYHAPGIGSMCGTTLYLDSNVENTANPQMLHGQICKNINITGGRAYAYANQSGGPSVGIGSGWAGPVDGVYINGSAQVYTLGGQNSPGIGSAGMHTNHAYATANGIFDVSNVIISGGSTVLAAVGGTSSRTAQYPNGASGIGCGHSHSDGRTGIMTNARVKPEKDWLAMVSQGTSMASAANVNMDPSPDDIEILENMKYTFVYFNGLNQIKRAPTPIDIGIGRIVVGENGVVQYTDASDNFKLFYQHNPEGYRIFGSSVINGENSRVLVTPGTTTTLYFDSLTITNNNWDCVTVTGADVTIVLLDGTTNDITCGYGTATTGGAAIAKNDATDGRSLIIRCEHSDESGHVCFESKGADSCGKLNAVGRVTEMHTGAIGSTLSTGGVYSGKGGFANLYIEGGIITAKAGDHAPGIGSMCGTTLYLNSNVVNTANPQMLHGQICKNINITGGRVYAHGGKTYPAAGIGSGWAGPVDGIYINGGAYVYALGSQNSPGIGSSGMHINHAYATAKGILNVSNIIISGGSTVVEAVGGTSSKGTQYPNGAPGIGCGHSHLDGRTGELTNVKAVPEEDYLAIVMTGTNIENAGHIESSPSSEEIDIFSEMKYILVSFNNTNFGEMTDTAIDIGIGRVVVTEKGVMQYAGVSDMLHGFYYNPDGYKLYGVSTIDVNNRSIVYVTPGITATLYFADLNITNNKYDCVTVSGADVTIILLNGTTNNLTCGYGDGNNSAGAIVKNDALDKRRLTIRCESSDRPEHMCVEDDNTGSCGKLNALGTVLHATAIGSTGNKIVAGSRVNVSPGFANLYIEGGIIKSKAGPHTPGIGTICGTAHAGSPIHMTIGQISRNINITGGRVYAYGGDCCTGIGSGWGGPVDGIYIGGGAYVYAVGGKNSPGIGSGGADSSQAPTLAGSYDVSNIIISGDLTVVEAVGYSTAPGIGCGFYNGKTGKLTNVQAQPEKDWLAMVKQGTSIANANYINGTPSPNDIDIKANMFYTLVYFQNLYKTAGVNDGPEETGEADDMVLVSKGDTIKYVINVRSGVTPSETYTVSDAIPAGMTLVEDEDSYTPGMVWNTMGGVTTVEWNNQTGINEFFFTVIVDSLDGKKRRDYINQAVLSAATGSITLPSNYTYHYKKIAVDSSSAHIRIKKVIDNIDSLGSAARAELAARPFIISFSDGADGSVILRHGETSREMTVLVDEDPVVVTVTEIVPMEFDQNYSVTITITHEDGAEEIIDGRDVTVYPGDEILITVTNTFTSKPFFKGIGWLRNYFEYR